MTIITKNIRNAEMAIRLENQEYELLITVIKYDGYTGEKSYSVEFPSYEEYCVEETDLFIEEWEFVDFLLKAQQKVGRRWSLEELRRFIGNDILHDMIGAYPVLVP